MITPPPSVSPVIAKPEHEIKFDPGQQAQVQKVLRQFEQNPYSPPSLRELQAELDEELQNALVESGELMAVSPDVFFRKQDYDSMVARIRTEIQLKGSITLAEVRDLFHTSRKYAQALLEHLDGSGVTVRAGDSRILKSK